MTILQAIILGIIQGITEFLPVSSSGHLILIQHFFEIANPKDCILFDLVCHLGTLAAIILVFHEKIREILTTKRTMLWQILIGTLPLFLIAAFLSQIKQIYNDPRFLSPLFLLTALLLFIAIRLGKNLDTSVLQRKRYRDPIMIGMFQALAVLPGVSRSGATISTGRLLGWDWSDALTFSFLLGIPAILGGTALEILEIITKKSPTLPLGMIQYTAGFFFSFTIGYGTLRLLINLAAKQKFMYFVWYCLVLSIGTLVYFNF